MSKPPDDLCICALVTTAYPYLSDAEVTGLCKSQWADIKTLVFEAVAAERELIAQAIEAQSPKTMTTAPGGMAGWAAYNQAAAIARNRSGLKRP